MLPQTPTAEESELFLLMISLNKVGEALKPHQTDPVYGHEILATKTLLPYQDRDFNSAVVDLQRLNHVPDFPLLNGKCSCIETQRDPKVDTAAAEKARD